MNAGQITPPVTLDPHSRDAVTFERAALIHAGSLLIFASWAFGGNARWVESVIMVLGGSGLLLTLAELCRRRRTQQSLRPFLSLVPILTFSVLVVLGSLHPSFDRTTIEGALVLLPKSTSPWLPTSAQADQSIRALLLILAVYLPCFNLSITVRSRRALLRLLVVLVANAVLLAVFGSLQKLTQSPGLYFGAVHSPNTRFFASFIYQNHWGAYALLMLAAGWGLVFRENTSTQHRSWVQSPAFLGVVGLFFLAASAPLSASRSCTVLALAITGIAGAQGFRRMSRIRTRQGKSVGPLLATLLLVACVLAVAAYQLAWPVMEARFADTRVQLAHMKETKSFGGRADLYRDTWLMGRDRPLFGWGLGSYPTVFTRYNSQVPIDRLPIYYEDAHSDWLQLFAETGCIGTLCFAAAIVIPVYSLRKARPLGLTPKYILAGCGIILLYALVEFPFGNHAVVLAFWLCLFAGVRLAQLDARERNA